MAIQIHSIGIPIKPDPTDLSGKHPILGIYGDLKVVPSSQGSLDICNWYDYTCFNPLLPALL